VGGFLKSLYRVGIKFKNFIKMKKVNLFSFCLFTLFCVVSFAQNQTGGVGQSLTFSHVASNSSKWEVFENGGSSSNSTVATISKTNGQSINFGVANSGTGTVRITFNCNASGKNFTVKWNTYNWLGGNVGSGTFQAIVTRPTAPTIVFQSINGACNQVTLCVSNPVPTATYAWNNATNGSFMGSGVCATFSAPPPTLVQVVSTCGTGPNSAISSTQAPPTNFTSGVSLNPGSFTTICTSEQLFLSATSNACVSSPNNWFWSSTGGSISNQSVQSGSTASASFSSQQAGIFTVTIQVTDFLMNVRSSDVIIQVLPQSDSRCNIFLLKKPKDPTDQQTKISNSNKEKVEDLGENTEGLKGDVKVSANNLSAVKKGIYPNPAKDFLIVEGIVEVERIQIVDLNGKVIRTVEIEQNEVGRTLNISELTNGMYILKKIKRDGQLEAAKFQVIH
jgi:Secretion system C-terminal sorting domain